MPKAQNLIGNKYGKLTVLSKTDERKHGYVVYECLCDCGNHHKVTSYALKSGNIKSCGCSKKETLSIKAESQMIGKKFGLLTVIGKDEMNKSPNGSYKWLCQCECGNTCSVSTQNLKQNKTQSCGCLTISHGELKIRQLLDANNIPYETEKQFDGCRNPKTNFPLRFDFYVNNQYLIEYDGRQHYVEDGGWGESLTDIQQRDEYKSNWCKENNIPLIRIPYTSYSSLTIEDLILPLQDNVSP